MATLPARDVLALRLGYGGAGSPCEGCRFEYQVRIAEITKTREVAAYGQNGPIT